MEESLKIAASYSALMLEITVVIIVAYGAIEALVRVVTHLVTQRPGTWSRREVWLRFATWILLALEFALGADIIRTAVAPTWDDIGKLASIAAIRTGLSFFLERDISEMGEPSASAGKQP
ncbi:DUF1622 domain-containing protein [Sphingomonas cavernae]|uniref:DUF1622 domain-containing protein n=1 Tax=Sphingomonas cavernae TaxID=2320861 RepID=A0A418W6J3_9SPHN|nr:DUF1622 domain-containing protein [Sphingomonas cavernae]RJF85655.1 DUF1622 domain-containing protein [Sphingomonas cavernae]